MVVYICNLNSPRHPVCLLPTLRKFLFLSNMHMKTYATIISPRFEKAAITEEMVEKFWE